DVDGALDAYAGPLLPGSAAPRVEQARDELAGALARAARASAPSTQWRWLQLEDGRDDAPAMAAFLRAAAPDDPRRALVAARLRSLQRRWGVAATGAAR
ncbi:MAG TPA: transcriptional regulator, partial [Solirubrobacteraceae bacterium]|nr:transcriptional regulator [Solirubrobacteraceae bacterium]